MKNYIIHTITVIVLLSCTNIESTNTVSSENEKLIKQYFDFFNRHDWKKMADMYAEVSEFKDPSFGVGIVKQSRQQIIEKYTSLSEVFPDVKDEIIKIYPSGEQHIIVEFVSSGTAPDSSTFKLPICTIFTIEEGKITKDFTYYDNFGDDSSK